MNITHFATFAISLIVFFAKCSFATGLADERQIRFDRIGVEDGLSMSVVNAIVQDQNGFLWFGTQNGLNRYDGYSIETYADWLDNPQLAFEDSIRSLLIDSKGRFWVGTTSGLKLSNRSSEKIHEFQLPTSSVDLVVYTLYEDSLGNVWIGTSVGLFKVNTKGIVSQLSIVTNEGYIVGGIYAVFEDSLRRIWIGTERSGLFVVNENELVVAVNKTRDSKPLLVNTHVTGIVEDDEGNLWVSTFNDGVFRVDLDLSLQIHYHRDAEDRGARVGNRIRALLKDSSGTIWVGTSSGLYRWIQEEMSFDHYLYSSEEPQSVSSNFIRSLYEDSGGVVWVGTFNGVSRFNQRVPTFPRFDLFSRNAPDTSGELVSSFAEALNGDVTIGSLSGLWKWSSEVSELEFQRPHELGISDPRVSALATVDDEIWVGTVNSGINVLRNGKVVKTFLHDPYDPTSLSNNQITDLYVDTSNTVWVSTFGGGVNQSRGNGRFKRYPEPGNLDGQFSDLEVIDFIEDRLGRYWIATNNGGVLILDSESGKVQVIRSNSGNSSILNDSVISLLATDNAIWIGTAKGLNYYDFLEQQILAYSNEKSLESNPIYGIVEDSESQIWVSTDRGLFVLNPFSDDVAKFDSTHGLLEGGFNNNAALRLSDGSLLFGGNNGFNAFHPDRVKQNAYVPLVRITRFELSNNKVNMRDHQNDDGVLELQYDDRVIGFQFAALDYTAPEKNQYRYMLEGFDQDWIDSGTNRQATYTNLDPGSYVFRVVGSNNDGIWNEEGASVPLVIYPAPWATWWAFAIYSLIGLFFFWQILEFNNRRLNVLAHDMSNKRIKLYLEALDETSESVLVADKRGNVMFANQTTNEILGKSPTELIRNSLYSILFQNEHEAVIAKEKVQQTGEYQCDVEYESDDGAVSTLEVIINTADHLNEVDAAFVAITRDVTEKKKAEEESQAYRKTLEKLVLERTEQLEKEIRDSETVRAKLANSLAEKEDLLKEVHHRVNNNLQVITSLLSIQANKVDEENTSDALNDSQQRIKSMALVHENLYQSQNLKHIDLESYVDVLTTHLLRTYAIDGLLVHVEKEIANVDLDITRAVPCGLVINELVTNALKHAFPERHGTANVRVSFVREGSDYVLTISDDGIGLPADFKVDTSTSIGMEIVTILTKQLEGTFKFIGDRGATFQITFPA